MPSRGLVYPMGALGTGSMAGERSNDRAKAAALTKALRTMFNRLQARPAPEKLISVVDQLEAAKPQPRKKAGR